MNHRDPGTGNVIQRQDGRWQASLQANNVRKTVYGKTVAEVKRKLGELRRQTTLAGALPDAGKRTVDDLLDHWIETSSPDWKPRTREDRISICNLHIRPALGNVRLNKLDPGRLPRSTDSASSTSAEKVDKSVHRRCRLELRASFGADLGSSPIARIATLFVAGVGDQRLPPRGLETVMAERVAGRLIGVAGMDLPRDFDEIVRQVGAVRMAASWASAGFARLVSMNAITNWLSPVASAKACWLMHRNDRTVRFNRLKRLA